MYIFINMFSDACNNMIKILYIKRIGSEIRRDKNSFNYSDFLYANYTFVG
jgi:hypothetical protein